MSPIPTTNKNLPHRVADFATIAEALDYAAQGETGITIYDSKGEPEVACSYRHLREQALDMARKLQSLNVTRGGHIAIIAETSIEFFILFYACQYAGLIPCPVPYAAYLGGKQAYLKRLRNMVQVSKAALICLPSSLQRLQNEIEQSTEVRCLSFAQIDGLQPSGSIYPLQPDEGAYVQFSSGSTSEPKGIAATQKSLRHNISAILHECIRIKPTDRAFSWLPLYHDMGMVGFALAPLFAQTSVDYLSPATFARMPALWLVLMSQNGSTITYAPSFGYDLAVKRADRTRHELNLASLRLAGIGGDMISFRIMTRFSESFAEAGFDHRAFTPSYGMAEATLLISFAHGLSVDCVDPERLEKEKLASQAKTDVVGKTLVCCGRGISNHELIIVDDHGNRLMERQIGQIWLRGPSIASYYLTKDGYLPITNDEDFLATGDLGYWVDGQLVVTGRIKDMILVNGRNIWPQDLEAVVTEMTDPVVKRAVAFAVEENDRTQIILLAEHVRADRAILDAIKAEITRRIQSSFGIVVHVDLVPPRSLPYTSSGKLARSIAKKYYLEKLLNGFLPSIPSLFIWFGLTLARADYFVRHSRNRGLSFIGQMKYCLAASNSLVMSVGPYCT